MLREYYSYVYEDARDNEGRKGTVTYLLREPALWGDEEAEIADNADVVLWEFSSFGERIGRARLIVNSIG